MSVVGVPGSPETVNGDVPVAWRKVREPDESNGHFPPPEPGGGCANGVQCDRDVPVSLPDGTRMYVGVYRLPASCDSAVPAILTWGPSGYARGGGPDPQAIR
jgi:predicted acyl esterase